jgi:glycerophosphoryl diester phosphodiesterase
MPFGDFGTLNIGHRGHKGATENTVPGFHEAIDMGAVMVELDVQLSKDGVPIVFHDYTFRRMAGWPGGVKRRTAAHIAKIELKGGGHIPTLREALTDLLPRIPVNIEMKYNHLHYRPLVHAVAQVIQDLEAESRVFVSSFLHQSLQLMNRYYPELVTAPLYLNRWTGPPHDDDLELMAERGWKSELPFQRPAAVLHYPMIDQAVADKFRELDLTLLTFTVDEIDEMERLIGLGVDGIVTNRPDRLDALLKGQVYRALG